MIYSLDDICESQDFQHNQKFVKAEHWKEACDEIDDLIKTKNYLQAENKKLLEALENIKNK